MGELQEIQEKLEAAGYKVGSVQEFLGLSDEDVAAVEKKVELAATLVFVFGSNRAGRHGKGAALHALHHCGAIYGQGEGLQGKSYAIPTKDERIRTLPLTEIQKGIEKFKIFAASRPDLSFQVTPIGCGLAGYKPLDIAPMFSGAPTNCLLPAEFLVSWF